MINWLFECLCKFYLAVPCRTFCALHYPVFGVSFNLENPGFSSTPSGDQPELPGPLMPLLQSSSGSLPSTPSSGDSTRCSCPRCHGRMNSFSVDCYSLCCKHRGSDCNTENRCYERLGLVCGGDEVLR